MIKEKELQAVLDSKIEVQVFYTQNVDNTRVYIDEESMREDFENKLKEIVEAVENY